MDSRKKRIILLCAVIAAAIVIAVGASLFSKPLTERATLRVFCAGSLAIPLEQVAKEFEDRNPGVKVVIEPSGSVLAVRKITELNKTADILAVADYRLIPALMMPEHASFCISFARNKIVLAYTNKSRYADEINSENWFRILMRGDVKYGFSNPNDDPCGYRALIVFALAEKYYGEKDLFKKLVADKSNLKVDARGDEFLIYVPIDFGPEQGSNLVIRSKSVDLISLLEAGALDYALEYKSVAVQRGLKYLELPVEIDLSDPDLDEWYQKVRVYLFYGTDKQRGVVGESIVYGLTIPRCAQNRDLSIEFVNFLLSDEGRRIFDENGQPFLGEFRVIGEAPKEIKLG